MDIQAYISSGVIESFVLGIATDEERSEVEQLAIQYPEVQKVINDFSSSLEEYAVSSAVAPPMDVKQSILKEISREFRNPAATPLKAAVSNTQQVHQLTPPPKYKVWRFAAAASIILLVISSALNIYLFTRYSDASSKYKEVITENTQLTAKNTEYEHTLNSWDSIGAFMADPNIIVVRMAPAGGKENVFATAFLNQKNQEVHVMANKLPTPAAGKQYQLWAMVNGKPVDAGMLSDACQGACRMNKFIPNAEAYAITLEQAGGSPTPTMSQLFVYGKV